jgi:hypothetical protein
VVFFYVEAIVLQAGVEGDIEEQYFVRWSRILDAVRENKSQCAYMLPTYYRKYSSR